MQKERTRAGDPYHYDEPTEPNLQANRIRMDSADCTPQHGSGSGSGSGREICVEGSTPDLRVINRPFVDSPQASPHKRLLSPVSSFSSFTSLFSPSRPSTPSPLRKTQSRTPTVTLSPLTATSLLFSTDIDPMPIYHPRPQHPEALSPQHRPVTPSRPPSRSEKLLREALMRDQERPPMPTAPSSTSQSPTRHRRRLSEVPAQGRTRSQEEHERAEDLARGAAMFRSPVVAGASPRSPSPAGPSLSRRHSHTQHQQQPPQHQHQHHHHASHQHHHHQGGGAPQSPSQSPLARRSSVKSQQQGPATSSVRPASPSPTTRSSLHQSPSNVRLPSISRQRVPYPLPLGSPEHQHQHQHQYPHSPAGEPVMMTPHEQVLRARLERVLQAGKVIGSAKPYDDWRRDDTSPTADDERSSASASSEEDDNVVRDENGVAAARVWRNGPVSGGKVAVAQGGMVHQRSRSSTEPALPATRYQQPQQPSSSAHPSPKRRLTSPNVSSSSSSQHHHHHHQHRHGWTGTTPPLVSDGSPTPPEEESEDMEDSMRLLTPPATPPSHLASYAYGAYTPGALVGKDGAAAAYVPSPYHTAKTSFSPVPSSGERRGRTLQGRGRPPPLHHEEEDEEEEESESESEGSFSYFDEDQCSSGSCSCSGSSSCQRQRQLHQQQQQQLGRQQPRQRYPHPHQQLPTSPNAYNPQHQQQLQMQRQFNARRASAKCREMEGYVSFAAVEGLGAPPESESGQEEEMRREKRDAKGGVVGGWVRRLWGSEGAGAGAAPGVAL